MNLRELTPQEKSAVINGLHAGQSYKAIGEELGVSGRTISRWAQRMVECEEMPAALLKPVSAANRDSYRRGSEYSWRKYRPAHMAGVKKATETTAQRRAAKLFPDDQLPGATEQALGTIFAPRRNPPQQ